MLQIFLALVSSFVYFFQFMLFVLLLSYPFDYRVTSKKAREWFYVCVSNRQECHHKDLMEMVQI